MHLRLIFTCLMTAALACAQGPRIGTIDFYGLRKVPEAKVRKALAVSEGGELPSSKAAVEERIEQVPGVVEAHLEAACCDDAGKAILYVGVEEKGAAHYNYRPPPAGDAILPAEIVPVYTRFLGAVSAASRTGRVGSQSWWKVITFFGNSITTVDPSRNRPISAPLASTMSWSS